MHQKIEHKPLTIKSLIDFSVNEFAKCPSVSFVDGTPMTYKELGEGIEKFQIFYFPLVLKKGDKVALFSQNMPNWVIAYFAVVSKGLVIVPILPDFTRQEVENVLLHSESKVLFVSDRLLSRIDNLLLPDLMIKISVDELFNKIRQWKIRNDQCEKRYK